MLKKRYLFLIIIVCLFAVSTVSAEKVTNETVSSNHLSICVDEVSDELQVVEFNDNVSNDYVNENNLLMPADGNSNTYGENYFSNEYKYGMSSLNENNYLSSLYYYDYSVSVYDTTIAYGSGGSISMSITPASSNYYKYDFYLKVYDTNDNLKISKEYYSTSSSYSKSYTVGAYDLSPGYYTIKIINNDDNKVMDTAELTVTSSSSSYSDSPSYYDYSVSVSDTTIAYGSGGSISMSITPASSNFYKYDFYLKVYDSNGDEEISENYYSTSSSYSKSYAVGAYDLSPGTYTIKIINYNDEKVMDTAKLTVTSSYPSYSDYSVSVSDTTFAYDSGGSISMSITPASYTNYKYNYYLKVYDSNGDEEISENYYSTSSSYSKSYAVGAYDLSPGTYTIKIINYNDNKVMDTAKLTVTSSSSNSPSYSDYSVSVYDTTIAYGSGGSISMSIAPASSSYYKYDYYLKVYDTNGNEKISQEYYSTSYSYSEYYTVGAYDLSPGTYTIKIINYDDNKVMDTAKLTVTSSYPSYSDYSVSVSDTTITYDSGGSISMSITPASYTNYKYNYYLKVYDTNGNEKISQEYYSTSYSYSEYYTVGAYDLSPGTYTIKIINYNDNKVMDTAKLTVTSSYPSYSDYSVSVYDTTIAYNSGGSISMSIAPSSNTNYKYDYYLKVYDTNGNEKISQEYYSTSSSYSKSYAVDAYELSPGTYTIKIINNKDNKVMDTANLIIKDTSNKLSAPDLTKYYGGPEKFSVTLTDSENKPLSGKSITISLNGGQYTRTTDSNGVASMNINLNSGNYDVTSEYGEKKVYSKITINPTIVAKDFSKIYKNGTQYSAKFTDSNGNLLKNTNVNLNINGILYSRTTNDQGIVRMNINLNPGTYVLTALNPVSKEPHATTIKVLPNIVENYDLTKYYKNNSQYRVRLLNDAGKPVGAGVDVIFNINGVFYTRSTDSNGYAKMNINLGEGNYIITADYKGLKVSNKINVLPILSANDLRMSYQDGSKFAVKLVDGQGKPFAGQTITMNINGVFYNRVTDENGVARLNINLQPNTYIVTCSYNGFNIAKKVIINPSSNPDVTPSNNEILYIDLPSYDTKTIVNKGKYHVTVEQWRVPPYSELDIILYDSNNNIVSKFNYNTYYYKDGTWHDMPVNEMGGNYHKARLGPDERIYHVRVELKGFSWY